MTIFSEDDLAHLAAPHVRRAWFAHLVFPKGERRLHTGMGPVTIGGHTWEGLSDPFGGQLVGIGTVEEPEFGSAAYVDVMMSGANRTFLRSIWADRAAVEGLPCDLYFAVFDAETGAVLIDLKLLFPGRLSGLRFAFGRNTIRSIQLKVVSPFEGLNFSETQAMWSPAGQRRRHPGDKGLDQINADIITEFKP